mgnify:CR=1 FL=1
MKKLLIAAALAAFASPALAEDNHPVQPWPSALICPPEGDYFAPAVTRGFLEGDYARSANGYLYFSKRIDHDPEMYLTVSFRTYQTRHGLYVEAITTLVSEHYEQPLHGDNDEIMQALLDTYVEEWPCPTHLAGRQP